MPAHEAMRYLVRRERRQGGCCPKRGSIAGRWWRRGEHPGHASRVTGYGAAAAEQLRRADEIIDGHGEGKLPIDR